MPGTGLEPVTRGAKDSEARSVISDSESGRRETGICHNQLQEDEMQQLNQLLQRYRRGLVRKAEAWKVAVERRLQVGDLLPKLMNCILSHSLYL